MECSRKSMVCVIHNCHYFVFNPLTPDINMHILLTVVHIFHMIPLRRTCFKNQDISSFVIISFILVTCICLITAVSDIVRRNRILVTIGA